jgi:hypothetical protein
MLPLVRSSSRMRLDDVEKSPEGVQMPFGALD